MPACVLYNLARMTVAAAPGLGAITLGAAVSSFLTFAQAGVQNGERVRYSVRDGTQREVGNGIYSTTGPTLTRTVNTSTNGNALIDLSAAALVAIVAAAEDFDFAIPATVAPPMDGVAAVGVATKYAREDHIHPSNTSRVAKAGDTMTGALTVSKAVAGNFGLTVVNTDVGSNGNATLTLQNGAGNSSYVFLTAAAASTPNCLSLYSPGAINFWPAGGLYGTWDATKLTVNNNFSAANATFSGTVNTIGSVIGQAPFPTASVVLSVGYLGGSSQYGMALRPATDGTTAIVFQNAAGTVVGSITQTASNIAVTGTSDERLKTDLLPFDAGPIIDRIQVYDFAWRITGERAHGVIAQEAILVFPEAVTHSEREDYWGVDYNRYVPILLQEIKTLRARVAALEQR